MIPSWINLYGDDEDSLMEVSPNRAVRATVAVATLDNLSEEGNIVCLYNPLKGVQGLELMNRKC
jgi:hypothetical protein